MNNHLYGPRHPVGPNKIHVESRNHKGQIQLSEKSEMRVSGSLMLFKQQITWSGNWKKARNSKRYGKDRPITLCPHLRSSELLDAGYDVWTRLACPVCGTEIATYRCAVGTKQDDIFYLHIWRSLGPCRSPFESQWRLVTDHSSTRNRRSLPSSGGLQAQWESSQRLREPSLFARAFSDQFRRHCRHL
jgi:hypothetical protein